MPQKGAGDERGRQGGMWGHVGAGIDMGGVGMEGVDEILTQAVAAVLRAAEIEGLPEGFTIRASGDTEPVERPYLVALTEDGTSPHPALRRVTLVLRLRTRADEQDSAESSAWHGAALGWLMENPAALHATLLPLGLRLMKFFNEGFLDGLDDEERGREYDQRWGCWVGVRG